MKNQVTLCLFSLWYAACSMPISADICRSPWHFRNARLIFNRKHICKSNLSISGIVCVLHILTVVKRGIPIPAQAYD